MYYNGSKFTMRYYLENANCVHIIFDSFAFAFVGYGERWAVNCRLSVDTVRSLNWYCYSIPCPDARPDCLKRKTMPCIQRMYVWSYTAFTWLCSHCIVVERTNECAKTRNGDRSSREYWMLSLEHWKTPSRKRTRW